MGKHRKVGRIVRNDVKHQTAHPAPWFLDIEGKAKAPIVHGTVTGRWSVRTDGSEHCSFTDHNGQRREWFKPAVPQRAHNLLMQSQNAADSIAKTLDALKAAGARVDGDMVVIDSMTALADLQLAEAVRKGTANNVATGTDWSSMDFAEVERRATVWFMDEAHLIEPKTADLKNDPERWVQMYGRGVRSPQLTAYQALMFPRHAGKSALADRLVAEFGGRGSAKLPPGHYAIDTSGWDADNWLAAYGLADAMTTERVWSELNKPAPAPYTPEKWLTRVARNLRDAEQGAKRFVASTKPSVYALHSAFWQAGFRCNGVNP
jgi:hypothetical protein